MNQKFVTNAQTAAPSYATGVANAGPKWASNTAAAVHTWQGAYSGRRQNGRLQRRNLYQPAEVPTRA